jgi:hypothetical protein
VGVGGWKVNEFPRRRVAWSLLRAEVRKAHGSCERPKLGPAQMFTTQITRRSCFLGFQWVQLIAVATSDPAPFTIQ